MYLNSIADTPAIVTDKIINATNSISTNVVNTISTNVTSTVSINSDDK